MLERELETKYSLATDVKQEEVVRTEWLDRSMFSVLRRGDVSEDEHEEVQRREEEVEVEDRLEGLRAGEDEGCAAWFSKREQASGITVDV